MMSKEKRRVPKLRFPGFTEDWEQRKLEDVCNVYDGTHQTPRYTNSGVMFVSVEDIETLESNKYITEEDFKSEFKVFPEYGDILLTRIGDVGSANVILDEIKRAYYVSLALLKPKDINSLFLLALLSSSSVQSEIWRRTLHIAFPKKINKNEINKVIVNQPSIPEQKKIGKLFFSLDQTITLHQRKLDNLKLKKKALLQKLFPKNGERYPELRFPGFTDAWEQRKFSEIYERAGQKNDLTYGIDKIISVANMYFKKDVTVGSEEYLKTYNVFKLGDIAFEGHTNKEYRYGRFVENTIGDGIVSHIFDVFTPKINLDINFWKDLIKYEPIMGPILRRCTKASRMMSNLTTKEFLEEQILCPTLEEQKLIGEFIVSLDKNITLHQRKLDHLQLQKKALLQQMFV
ncbi:MAG: restriction endonuclease subunit S [Veillonella nakazawae]